jgi:hypothetical protein
MALPAQLVSNLKDRDWRLNNLYWIKDKRNKRVKFVMNPEQRVYFENQHTRNLILKARQLGFTTEQLIIQLDCALFESGSCALIAHSLNDAKRLFREKLMYAYNNLPDIIRRANPAKNERADELVFKNGGYVAVSSSFRGGTLTRLHVSEFGKICAKYPEKAKEIVTGAFEAVASDCVITIESTAEGRAGYFYDYSTEAEKLAISGAGLGPLDWKFFFFAWWRNPEYAVADGAINPALAQYFDELAAKHAIKLSDDQKRWYSAKFKTLGSDIKREYPSAPSEAFEQSIEGAYYRQQFIKIYAEKRICKLHKNETPVFTFWDIGVGDSTAIWFVRFVGNEIHVIDYYENSGEGLKHYMKELKDRAAANGWKYGEHWAPHDIENREFAGDGKSRRDIARSGFDIDGTTYSINFHVVPKTGIDTGIDSAREILPRCYFDEEKASEGVNCLENYRKEWDEKRGTWKSTPLHDWSSHGADAFRYLAVYVKNRYVPVMSTKIGMAY